MNVCKRSLRKVLKNKNKLLSMLGLAARARKVVSGEFPTQKAIQNFSACLVIVAADASENTKKKFQDKCAYYEILFYIYGTKEELGHAIGKEMRASLAVTDEGFAEAVHKLIEGGSDSGKN